MAQTKKYQYDLAKTFTAAVSGRAIPSPINPGLSNAELKHFFSFNSRIYLVEEFCRRVSKYLGTENAIQTTRSSLSTYPAREELLIHYAGEAFRVADIHPDFLATWESADLRNQKFVISMRENLPALCMAVLESHPDSEFFLQGELRFLEKIVGTAFRYDLRDAAKADMARAARLERD